MNVTLPQKVVFAHASHVSFPGGVRLVIVGCNIPQLPPRVQLKGPHPSSVTCMEFSHAASQASLAPQILDFYPKIGIAGMGRFGGELFSKVTGVLYVFFVVKSVSQTLNVWLFTYILVVYIW